MLQIRCAALLFMIFAAASCVDAQVVRNRLPLVTETSVLADRLYHRILSSTDQPVSPVVFSYLEQLRSQHAGKLISIDDRRQLEATLLADLLVREISNPPITDNKTPTEKLDRFLIWRSVLRGELGPAELIELGDQHWLRGDIHHAQQCWRLVEREFSNEDSQSPPNTASSGNDEGFDFEVQKRLIVADFLTGHLRLGRQRLTLFVKQFPEKNGRVAGEEGVVSEILNRLAESLTNGGEDAFIARRSPLPFQKVRYDFISRGWELPVDCGKPIYQSLEPIRWNNVLILQDAAGVRALDVETGTPEWPIGPDDAGYIYQSKDENEISEAFPFVCSGGTISDNLWIGRTGANAFDIAKKLSPPEQSRISSLNLAAQGRLEWTVTPAELSLAEQDQPRLFTGKPIVANDRLFVPMRTAKPDNRLQIACLRIEDGSEIWVADIASNLRVLGELETFADQLAIDGDTIYWLVDGVALACINGLSGQLYWASAVEPLDDFDESSKENEYSLVVFEDSVICATVNGIAAFDKFNGKLNWEQFVTMTASHLPGINDGLVFCDGQGLRAIDILSGDVIWQHQKFHERSASNKGTLLGRSLFYCDNDFVFTIDTRTGRVVQQDRLASDNGNTPISSVNLLGSQLIIHRGDNVEAYRTRVTLE